MKSALVFMLTFLVGGCSLFQKKGSWGKSTFYPVRGQSIKSAFIRNISSPHVWAPVAGAAAIHLANADQKISDSVNSDRPLYQNQNASDTYSDTINQVLLMEMYASIFLTPSAGEGPVQFVVNKVRGGLLVNMASSASRFVHHDVRKRTNRLRPDGSDRNSLPSGHSAEAGSRRVLVARNIEAAGFSSGAQLAINSANTVLSSAVLFARVEGKRHYPTDVLLGYALGNFVSGFLYDSLINFDSGTSIGLAPTTGGATASLSIRF